jgi:hypothetical protein
MFDRWLKESDWSIIKVILNSLKVVITTVTWKKKKMLKHEDSACPNYSR